VLDTQAQINGKGSGEYAAVQLEVARRHVLLGEFDVVTLTLRTLAASFAQRYGADDPRTAQAQVLLAQALLDHGNANEEARAAAEAANATWTSKDDPGAPAALDAAATLAQWFAMRGDAANAQPLLARVEAPDSRATVWARVAPTSRTRRCARAATTQPCSKPNAAPGSACATRPARSIRKPLGSDCFTRATCAVRARGDADVIDASMRPVFERVSGFGVPAWLRNRVD
jgi:hypothetical protein